MGEGLFIVTKGERGPVALYRFPSELRAGATARLERVGKPLVPRKASANTRITGAASSPDGRWVALRTHDGITFFRAAQLATGNWQNGEYVDLRVLRERQGEGVSIGPDSTVYLVGEGGGQSRPGSLARLNCTLGR